MFYSQFILAKKGPLGTIWIAAHLERKLRKNQVADTDIGFSVDSILFPEMPIALRLSSHLLLGVVRIYSRKVNYLFDDCSEALLKVKQAFRSTAVDLPPEESTAPYHSITLPETFDLDDFELPGSEIYQGNYVDHHVSSKEQITLQDTMEGVVYSTSNFGLDERFGDGDACGLDLDEELMVEKAEHAIETSNSEAMPVPAGNIVNNQQIEEYDGENEPIEYAHAPCTPGLWEEPNLSNIQETSAYDDHQEPENHTITESAVKENLEKENVSIDHQLHNNQFDPLEKSPPLIVTTPFPESNIVDQVKSMSPIPEMSETVNDPVKMVELLYKNAMQQASEVVQTVDNNREIYLANQENSFQPTNELELNTVPSEDSRIQVESKSTHDKKSSFDFIGLRPCVTLSNHDAMTHAPSEITSLPSVETSRMEGNLQETYGPSNAVQVAPIIPNVQVENVIETEFQVNNTNSYTSNFHPPEKVLSFSQENLDVHVDLVQESTPVHQSIPNVQVDIVNEREVQVNNTSSNFPAPEKLLSFSENVPNNFVPESTPVIAPGYAGNDMYSESLMTSQSMTENNTNRNSGRKRSITESSMTSQSLHFNLNESSSFFTINTNSNMTKESFRDDDLLSSILVGRNSSILKMKPTPTPTTEAPPTKRRRQSALNKTTAFNATVTATKSGLSKRKVVWDDNMVLHGDTIRQQLTNTEDIRRLRKKAPCTHSEISIIQKQFWEDELFGEPILTGMSNKLTCLQRQLYDISKIVVSQYDSVITDPKSVTHNDEKEIDIQPELGTENTGMIHEENKEQEDNFDPVPMKDVFEPQPVDAPEENKDQEDNFDPIVVKDVSKDVCESQPIENHTHDFDNNTTNLDYYENQQQMQMHTTGDFTELFGPEHDVLDHATAMEIDTNNDNTFQDVSVMHPDVELQTHADVAQNDTSAPPPSHKAPTLLTGPPPGFGFDTYKKTNQESVIPPMDININQESIERNLDSEVKVYDGEIPEERQEFVDDGLTSDIVNNQETEIRNNIEEEEEEDAVKNLVSNGEQQFVPYNDADGYPVLEDVLLDEREKPRQQLNLQDIPRVDAAADDDDYMHTGVANDTDFLNLDDVDDDDEAADDYMPDGDAGESATKIQENSGWSSRTRSVAKYLQIMFDKEGERGRNMLGVNNLLAGKTRKEASRMFFETLVLKTKDYIHVEQSDPYENINVFPRAKLLKSEFYKD
ncbi:hypothetical protein LXL04_012734 [Taraxacum kok-saghyz]